MAIDETLAKALDSLHFISKPAGWTGLYEKSVARSKLDGLRAAASPR